MTDKSASTSSDLSAQPIDHRLDTKGLICPEPVMMLHKMIRTAQGGEVIEIFATDPASSRDIPNFCRHLGHELLLSETVDQQALIAIDQDTTADCEADEPVQYDEVYRYLVKKKS